MNIGYTTRGFDLTEQIRKHTQQKLKKILSLDELLEVNMILEYSRGRYKAELLVHNRNTRLTATEVTSDVFKSINSVIDKMQKQIKRHKEKLVNRKRLAPPRVTKLTQNMAVLERTKTPRLIRARKQDIKPMSQDEALLQLETSGDSFLLFRNIRSDKIHVLFRRKDGNLGILDPDI
jgi:putative sigma-54 modulation protein